MRILVTGSAGLVGTELMAALRAAGHDPVPFDISRPDPSSAAAAPAAAAPDDICDPARAGAAMRGCDGIIHLAAISRVAWGEEAPALCHHVNVTGTATLLDLAQSQSRRPWFLFASSREVYGDPAVSPVHEDAPIAPLNHYGRSKAAGEALVSAARENGLHAAIIRLSNVYGTERDHADRAVPSLLWRAIAGEELQITGADNFFDFVHVDDCVRGLLTVAKRLEDGQDDLPPVHLATGLPTSLADLASAAQRVAGSTSKLTVLPPRSFDVSGFCGDPSRAATVLGWRAEISLADGLERLRGILVARGRPLDPVFIPTVAGQSLTAPAQS